MMQSLNSELLRRYPTHFRAAQELDMDFKSLHRVKTLDSEEVSFSWLIDLAGRLGMHIEVNLILTLPPPD